MAGITQRSRIAVLGANGRVGRMIMSCGHNHDLIPVIRPDKAGPRDTSWAPGMPLPKNLQCDAVVAAWGVTHGSERDLDTNVSLANQAQKFANAVGAERVVHCSSAGVYGPVQPWTESAKINPTSGYGLAKLRMEQAIRRTPIGPKAVILRIGNVAGADSLFKAGLRSGHVTLDRFPDGRGPIRSYIGPQTLTQVMLWAAVSPDTPPLLNVASSSKVGMEDVARAMGWHVSWRPAADTAQQLCILEIDLLQKYLHLDAETAQPSKIAEEVNSIVEIL